MDWYGEFLALTRERQGLLFSCRDLFDMGTRKSTPMRIIPVIAISTSMEAK
jgi:hypothetical protein